MSKSIYLAGKIHSRDWRCEIVPQLRRGEFDVRSDWPILPRAIWDRFDYVGPFFTECSEDVHHGESGIGDHGTMMSVSINIASQCTQAIRKADIFFAWIESTDCFGTLVEAGMATALGKRTMVAMDPEFVQKRQGSKHYPEPDASDLWFLRTVCGYAAGATPGEALRNGLMAWGDFFDSPLEYKFHRAWTIKSLTFPLTPQLSVLNGRYRLDFAHEPTKTAIELDGFTYHGDKDAFERDRHRDRELVADGWTVLRFTGADIRDDVFKCVDEVARHLAKAQSRLGG